MNLIIISASGHCYGRMPDRDNNCCELHQEGDSGERFKSNTVEVGHEISAIVAVAVQGLDSALEVSRLSWEPRNYRLQVESS